MSESKYSQVRCSGGEDEEEDNSGAQNQEISQPLPSHFKKSSAELSSNLMNGNPESSEFDSGLDGEEEIGSLRRMAPLGDEENGSEKLEDAEPIDGDEIPNENEEHGTSNIRSGGRIENGKQRDNVQHRLEESEEIDHVMEEDKTNRDDRKDSHGIFSDERGNDEVIENEEERISEEIEIRKGSSANPNTPLITKG